MRAIDANQHRLPRAAANFIDSRLASGRVSFSLTDLVEKTGLSLKAARSQLRRLDRKVTRVSRMQQFFLIVGPEHQVMGAPPPAWWLDDYFHWLRHPYYLGLQSAAEAYGSSPHAVQVTQVVTDDPRRQLNVGRIRVRFFVKRGVAETLTQQSSSSTFAPLRVSSPAATAFDLVRYAVRIGGIARATETLCPLLRLIRTSDLKQVLDAENETATTQRLGYIIDTTGKSNLAKVIHDWLPSHPRLTPLTPSRGDRVTGPVVERWGIILNSQESAR